MENYQESDVTQDERLLAFVCQVIAPPLSSIILFFVMKNSRFIRFYALQSVYFHSVILIIIGFSVAIMFLSTVIENFALMFLAIFAMFVWVVPIIDIIYSIIIGIYALKGKIKKYPIVGNLAYNKIYPEMASKHPIEYSYYKTAKPTSKGMI
jgi:uncharacterized membrane protein